MKIITNRNIRLSGERFESGKPKDCADADGKLAIRHGWAIEAPKKGKAADKPAEGDKAAQ